MDNINIKSINERITDRTNAWYWQIGRNISLSEAMIIWSDKHRGIKNDFLLTLVNHYLDIKLATICEVDQNAQENLGFINSVRKGALTNGQEVIIRCHPKGIRNGYFHVESLAAKLALEHGLPSYNTYCIHDLESNEDIAFQVIEKCEGVAIKKWLETNPNDVDKIMIEAGKTLATLHTIKVPGFGPFDNEEAKKGNLIGIHSSFAKSVRAGLESSINILVDYKVITTEQSELLNELYNENSPLLECNQGVLIHKDYVDWNLLTNGNQITGILDWDECAAGDPIADIASWSSMTPLCRLDRFLEGYFSNTPKPELFDKKLQLLSLRCTIDNMALRSQRTQYIKSDFLTELIELGKEQLLASFKYFDIPVESANKKGFVN